VLTNIGGVYQVLKNTDQEGPVYTHVPKDIQSNSMQFIIGHVFNTPNWILNNEILGRIGPSGEMKRIFDIQTSHLNRLLQDNRIARLLEGESVFGNESYTFMEMMNDLRKGIWVGLYNGKAIDIYKRNLQLAWINKMSELLYGKNKDERNTLDKADIPSIALFQLNSIKRSMLNNRSLFKDPITKVHISYCLKRIEDILASGILTVD
jgi:hypothetical protein